MNAGITRALVIGGGFSGMAAAIQLSDQGVAVDLVEIDAGWRSYGAGISLHGATFRVFDTLGILEGFRAQGAMTDGVEMRGPQDQVFATLPTPSAAPGLPGTGGTMRALLAKLLADRVRQTKTNVRLGLSFSTITPDSDGVDVTFTDGTRARYDLVIGADGLNSAVRRALWPEAAAPRYVGQAVWRAVLERPAHLPTVAMWMVPGLKAGINHVSETHSYLFLTEDRPVNGFVEADSQLEMLKRLLAQFPSPTLREVADKLSTESQIVYRPLEMLLLPQPWAKQRVVLIGDAVHATTPHMAAGAMIGLEDAVVLSEEIGRAHDLASALDTFQSRRWERCRMVVENSYRLAEIEQGHGTPEEHKQIMGKTLGALAQPI
jgi:2-polyprenyl-6-methoxyphenol hydroxylase-like FAD-dependent oxidoreductase